MDRKENITEVGERNIPGKGLRRRELDGLWQVDLRCRSFSHRAYVWKNLTRRKTHVLWNVCRNRAGSVDGRNRAVRNHDREFVLAKVNCQTSGARHRPDN